MADTEDEMVDHETGTFTRRVERDPDFKRYYADSSTIHPMGPEIELAFLSLAPNIKDIVFREGSTQPVTVNVLGPVSELFRLRLDTEAAHNLAFNLLLTLTQTGIMSIETVEGNLNKIKSALSREGTVQ